MKIFSKIAIGNRQCACCRLIAQMLRVLENLLHAADAKPERLVVVGGRAHTRAEGVQVVAVSRIVLRTAPVEAVATLTVQRTSAVVTAASSGQEHAAAHVSR